MLLRSICCGIRVLASPPLLLGSIALQNGSDMAALKTTSRTSTASAGVLAYQKGACGLEVVLVHPGGRFWRKKDGGAWSIPKGEMDDADAPKQIARRERSSARALLRPLGGDPTARRQARFCIHRARAILTRRHPSAILLISNGRPEPVDGRVFPGSIAENG